jgi:hypothetical protein
LSGLSTLWKTSNCLQPGSCMTSAQRSRKTRASSDGALISPERQTEKQQKADWQVNLSYLLGLDWQIPFEFNKVRIRERSLEELRKAAKQGALGDILGTVSQLRPQVAIAESKAKRLREQLENFEVLAHLIHRMAGIRWRM